jgi:hypothetical protein
MGRWGWGEQEERETFPVPHTGNGSKDSTRNIFKKIKESMIM